MPFKLSSYSVFHMIKLDTVLLYKAHKHINHKVENHSNYLYNHWLVGGGSWLLISVSLLHFKRSRWRQTRLPQFQSSWCGRTCQAGPVIHKCGRRNNPSGPAAGSPAVSWICQESIITSLSDTKWRRPGHSICMRGEWDDPVTVYHTCIHRRRRGLWRSRAWELPAGQTEPPPSSSTSDWRVSRHGRNRPEEDCPGPGSYRRRP